ncbi:MAG: DUF3224 domain-containing protein [Ignavibacteriae bacterium]|nr:DUF3224 domain-containing protein [Ignavibacteriota bacterium]MCB9215743.1 DUF3224 domain-containing protein [Ignavibacteria bacterium]
MTATGTFNVQLQPLEPYTTGSNEMALGRMSINKMFNGELEAVSKGEMLSARTPTPGSAGYVALEQVEGTLGGKKGTFILQHFGVMRGGENRLVLEVVPNSGTGELLGLSGAMEITIEEGEHRYLFEYKLS